jgi:hypothetical protein
MTFQKENHASNPSNSLIDTLRTLLLILINPLHECQKKTPHPLISYPAPNPLPWKIATSPLFSLRFEKPTLEKSVFIHKFFTFSLVNLGQNSACWFFLRRMRTTAREVTDFLHS